MPAEFLRIYWQQQPVLLPQLIRDFTDLISPEELAGLACEASVESRLVKSLKQQRWSVEHGPFAESLFSSLPEHDWTLLVQAVDQWIPELAELKNRFSFLPSWRIDDIMVSYATDGAGVGPHFDHYDVFLLQGFGQRRWQIGNKVAAATTLDNQDGVSILRDFSATQEFVLNAGDALYIPPQFAHWGHSIGSSTCYSIGFRAPALAEMLEGFSDALIASSSPAQRYLDHNLQPAANPALLDTASVQQAFTELRSAFDQPQQFRRWFGCFVTQPKYPENIESPSRQITLGHLRQALTSGSQLTHHPASRFAYLLETAEGCATLFVNGEVLEVPLEHAEAVSLLCGLSSGNRLNYPNLLEPVVVQSLVLRLLNQGSLLLR